jgi:ribosomal protein S18 acetylase RimI-like enzyme
VWSVLTDSGPQRVQLLDDAFGWAHEEEATVVAPSTSDAHALLDDLDGLVVAVDRRDVVLQRVLLDRGYRERADAPFDLDLRRSTDVAIHVHAPDGYLVRPARPDDDLVAVHRASWRPADLPFAPGHAPTVGPDAASSLSADVLAAVQAHPGYDRDLHLVVEDPERELVASCIVWLDRETRSAAIEPLGVVPEHRNRGLARSMCLHAAAAVHDHGGREVVIHPRGDDAYPAPRAAYRGAGFVDVGRTTSYSPP